MHSFSTFVSDAVLLDGKMTELLLSVFSLLLVQEVSLSGHHLTKIQYHQEKPSFQVVRVVQEHLQTIKLFLLLLAALRRVETMSLSLKTPHTLDTELEDSIWV